MPVLNWIGKDKIANHDKELPFRVLKPNGKLSYGNDSGNLLIKGDNLEALKALMPFYYGQVKCIFIDPPYNTGNEGWVYNDKVNAPQIKQWLNKVVGAEGEDLCRHDKWLCMMYPRLKLLKDLLKDDGCIFVAIDDNEVHNLRLLMDEMFGEKNFVATITWEKADSPKMDSQYFSSRHDFILVYAKNKSLLKLNKITYGKGEQPSHYDKVDESGRSYYLKPLRAMGGQGETRAARPKLYYKLKSPDGDDVYPKLQNGKDGAWRWSKEKVEAEIERIEWRKGANGWTPYFRIYADTSKGRPPETILFHYQVGSSRTAKAEVKKVLPVGIKFDTPKPVDLIKFLINISSDKDDIILDSFAGSGTTGQAVLEMNHEDDGERRFILVELEKEIAEDIASARLKHVAEKLGIKDAFQYLDLNGELFDRNGFINKEAKFEDLASYIFYTETKTYADLPKIKAPFIGKSANTSYYLKYSSKGNNVLDDKLFEEISKTDGVKVIYADKTLVDDEKLSACSIIFKQIPYELKNF